MSVRFVLAAPQQELLFLFFKNFFFFSPLWAPVQDRFLFLFFLSFFFKKFFWSSRHGLVVKNLTIIHEDVGLIPGPAQWVKDTVLV